MYVRSFIFTLLLATVTAAGGSCAPDSPRRIQIMPLGASITQGVGGTHAGYRGPLDRLLEARGIPHRFVGSSTENPGPLAEAQPARRPHGRALARRHPRPVAQPDDLTHCLLADPTAHERGISLASRPRREVVTPHAVTHWFPPSRLVCTKSSTIPHAIDTAHIV